MGLWLFLQKEHEELLQDNSVWSHACSLELLSSTAGSCNYRICIYMPCTFSPTHRSIVFRTISRIHERWGQRPLNNPSLWFEMPNIRVIPELYHWSSPDRSHEYSRILEISSFQKRRSPRVLGMMLRKSFSLVPNLERQQFGKPFLSIKGGISQCLYWSTRS